MIIPIPEYLGKPIHISGEDPVEILEWESNDYDVLTPAGPIKWDVDANVFESEMLVKGKISAEFSGICCRCGRDMCLNVSDDICEMKKIPENTNEVDLTSELRDAIILALPSHPICNSDCKGLCPKCGKHLTAETCSCVKVKKDDAWNVLDNLFK